MYLIYEWLYQIFYSNHNYQKVHSILGIIGYTLKREGIIDYKEYINQIEERREAQNIKHPQMTNEKLNYFDIVIEEYGEAVKARNDYVMQDTHKNICHYKDELIDLAASLVRFVELEYDSIHWT